MCSEGQYLQQCAVSQSQSNGGTFHQRTPVLPARHIQDALLMWFSFEKATRLVIVMTSPAVRYRGWLKSLVWSPGALSVGRTPLEQVTVIFLAPTGAHKQPPPPPTPPSPSLPPHVLVEGDVSPQGRLLLSQMPADAASYCCSTSINILAELTRKRELHKAIIPLHAPTDPLLLSLNNPTITLLFFLMFSLWCDRPASLPLKLGWDQTGKSIKQTLRFDSDMKHPKLMHDSKCAICQKKLCLAW